ncbi:MAG: AAA family ATPase [Planctomycetaceae bacterium]|nr:AAA family ATPase [Planctomycetaceae bacterium]
MDWIWDSLSRQLADNQFFSGGLILMLGGAAVAVLRHVPGKIWGWTKERFLIQIDIPDREAAFDWLDKWLAAHNYARKRARRLTVRTRNPDYQERAADPAGDHRPRVLFSPAPGKHWLFYRGRLVILDRQRADPEKTPVQGSGPAALRESFSITIVGRNRQLAWQLIDDARDHALPLSQQLLTIHHITFSSWGERMQRLPRPPESVVLKEGMLDDLIDDCRRFLSSRQWYLQRGVPYRRGFLLYGPPGTGKSSAVVAVASALKMDIALLNLTTLGLDDNDLADRLAQVPPNAIVLIEDIDCAFSGRKPGEEKSTRITFSGLLNAIDGVAAGEGRILFATTNHPDRLDPALVRPGRIDRQLEIGLAEREQCRRIFQRFFPEADECLAENFAASIPNRQLPMATIQAYLIRYADSAEEAAERTAELVGEQIGEEPDEEMSAAA